MYEPVETSEGTRKIVIVVIFKLYIQRLSFIPMTLFHSYHLNASLPSSNYKLQLPNREIDYA